MKTAVITGVTGQDGAYLAKLLLSKGYRVVGAYRRLSTPNFWRIKELGIVTNPNLDLVEFDLTDQDNAIRLIEKYEPDEVYNLAAQSFVGVSFEQPYTTSLITGLGALSLLEAIRIVNSRIKYYQASTSEMFGKVQSIPQNEKTPFYPRSPYGVAKLYAHWMTINYRESYGIFGCCGILFNHESPLRGPEFVTRKITKAVAKIKANKQSFLELGNLSAQRDWGYAGDYVDGMFRIMQAQKPDSFVLATGRTYSIRELVTTAFLSAGINVAFKGDGMQEVGINTKDNRVVVKVNPKYYRPAEVDLLVGDSTKARSLLAWEPKVAFRELINMMVRYDLSQEGVLS